MRTACSLPYGGGLHDRDPLDRDPSGQRPPGQSPLNRDPMWTDKHLWKDNLRKFRLRAVKTHLDEFITRYVNPFAVGNPLFWENFLLPECLRASIVWAWTKFIVGIDHHN